MGKISSAVSHSVDTDSVPHSNVVLVKKPRNGGGNFVTDGGSRNGSQRPEKLALHSDSESVFSSHGARGKSSSNFPPDFSDQGQGDDKSEDDIEKMSGSDGETEKRLEKDTRVSRHRSHKHGHSAHDKRRREQSGSGSNRKKHKHAPRSHSQFLPDSESGFIIDDKICGLSMSESDGNNNDNNEDGVISQQEEEEASLGSASIFSASDHTDGSDNDISDHEHGKKQASTIEKWRFDPTGGKDEHSWHLLRGQDAFTTKYFSEYVGESAIKESILKSCPKPSTDVLKPLVLDSDIVDLLPGSSQTPIKHADGSFKRIQVRLLDTMGPLGKLWSELEKAALHGNGKCDAKELLELAEKSVTLVGQTNVLINHNRRLNVLSRFMKDSKKATDILSQNQRNRTSLFGNSFYKALYQKAKGRQHSQEIKRGLAAKPFRGLNRRQRHAEVHSGSKTWTHQTNTVQPAWPHKRPFQQGPSASNTSNSGGRGARRGTGPFKRGRGGFKNRYVYLTFNHPTNTRSKSNSISSRFEQSRRSCRSHRTLSKEDKSPDTIGRSTDFLSPQLGKTYKRSLDIGNCSWLPDRFSGSTQSITSDAHPDILQVRERKHDNPSTRNVGKGRNRICKTRRQSVRGSCFSSSKKVGQLSTDFQSQTAESVCTLRTLQNGKHADADDNAPIRRLDGDTRSKGRVLLHSDTSRTPQISPVLVGQHSVPVSNAPIRVGVSTKGIYQTTTTSGSFLATDGYQTSDIFGRCNPVKSIPDRPGEGQAHCSEATPWTGICSEFTKIHAESGTAGGIPGILDKLKEPDTVPPTKEVINYSGDMPPCANKQLHTCPDAFAANRHADIDSTGCAASPSTLQIFTNAKNQGAFSQSPELQCIGDHDSGLQGRVAVVASPLTGVEWEDHGHSHTRLSDNNRFITKRMGGNIQRCDNAGTLVPSRESRTHKCSRIKGRYVCSDGLCQRSVESTHTSQGGQSSHHGSDKQNGGSKVSSSVYDHKRVLGVLPISWDHNYCRTRSRSPESNCGQRKPMFHGQELLDAQQSHLQPNRNYLGKHGSGSVCRQINLPEKVLCQLEARSRGYSNRRIYTFMVVPKRVCLPSVLSDKPMSGQSKEGQGDTGILFKY